MSFASQFRKYRAVLGGIILGPLLYLLCQHFIRDFQFPREWWLPAPFAAFLVGFLKLLTLPVTTIFSVKGMSYADMIYWAIIVWFWIWANDIRPPKKGDSYSNRYRKD